MRKGMAARMANSRLESRAGDRDQHGPSGCSALQSVGIDGYRTRPSEASGEDQERAQRVQMSQRVQGQAAVEARRVVAQFVRRPCMGEFVDRRGR